MDYYVGIDIGGTKTSFTLACYIHGDLSNNIHILRKKKTVTPIGDEAVHAMDFIYSGVESVLEKKKKIRAIGISCGGPIDSGKGVILSPPNLYGWNAVPIVKKLAERYACPVYIQNDADACALAEWNFGAGRNTRNMVFLTMGTGMGAGLILNSQLYSGSTNMAGEIGHVRMKENGPAGCGKIGSFEGFCSGSGIAQIARTYALCELQNGRCPKYCSSVDELPSVNAHSVAEAARAGDAVAKHVYSKVGEMLGAGLAIVIDLLNPEMIVIGSIFVRDSALLVDAMKRTVWQEALSASCEKCQIVPALLGEQLGDFGAITVALYGEGVIHAGRCKKNI